MLIVVGCGWCGVVISYEIELNRVLVVKLFNFSIGVELRKMVGDVVVGMIFGGSVFGMVSYLIMGVGKWWLIDILGDLYFLYLSFLDKYISCYIYFVLCIVYVYVIYVKFKCLDLV